MNKKRETICVPKLIKTRGWPNTLIMKFLPIPNTTKTVPIYKSAAPMILYNINKVKRIERSQSFKETIRRTQHKKLQKRRKRKHLRKSKTWISMFLILINLNRSLEKSSCHFLMTELGVIPTFNKRKWTTAAPPQLSSTEEKSQSTTG